MKRNFYCVLFVLFIFSACTQPKAEMQSSTAMPTLVPSATVIPTPTTESHIEKLTDEFKEQTEELFGQTNLQEVDGEWSLINAEGRQAAGFKEGEWWINYALVGPRSIPSWDRGEYLCRDGFENSCGKINPKMLAKHKVEDYPFPEDFEKNPFVKEEMEWIENWLVEDLKVPLGRIPKAENIPQYGGWLSVFLKKVTLGQGKDFRWTIIPLLKNDNYPNRNAPIWLVKVDTNGVVKKHHPYFYKINDSGENVSFKNESLKIIYAGAPYFDQNFEKSDSDQYLWTQVGANIVLDATEEWQRNERWTLIPWGDKGDVFLVQESQGDIYKYFFVKSNTLYALRRTPGVPGN